MAPTTFSFLVLLSLFYLCYCCIPGMLFSYCIDLLFPPKKVDGMFLIHVIILLIVHRKTSTELLVLDAKPQNRPSYNSKGCWKLQARCLRVKHYCTENRKFEHYKCSNWRNDCDNFKTQVKMKNCHKIAKLRHS